MSFPQFPQYNERRPQVFFKRLVPYFLRTTRNTGLVESLVFTIRIGIRIGSLVRKEKSPKQPSCLQKHNILWLKFLNIYFHKYYLKHHSNPFLL